MLTEGERRMQLGRTEVFWDLARHLSHRARPPGFLYTLEQQ